MGLLSKAKGRSALLRGLPGRLITVNPCLYSEALSRRHCRNPPLAKTESQSGQNPACAPAANRVIALEHGDKTRKKTSGEGRKMQYEASIHASNVMIIDPLVTARMPKPKVTRSAMPRKSGVVISRTKIEAAIKSKDAQKEGKKGKGRHSGWRGLPFWKKIGFGADAVAGSDAAMPKTAEGGCSSSYSSFRYPRFLIPLWLTSLFKNGFVQISLEVSLKELKIDNQPLPPISK